MNRIKRMISALLAAALITVSTGCNTSDTAVSLPFSESVSVDGTTTSATSSSTDKTPSESVSSAVGETTSSEDISPTDGNNISVSYNIGSTWEESGKQVAQLDFILKSGSAVNGWNVQIDFGQNVEPMQFWNCEATSSGSVVTATNAAYNGEVPAGGETSFGIILKADNTPEPKSISVNGAAVIGNAGQTGNTPVEENPPAEDIPPAESTPPVENNTSTPDKESKPSGNQNSTYGLVSECGQLSVKGADLVGANGQPVQLRGVSTHGIQWFPAFANKSAFQFLRDEWNINVIRLAMYTGAGEGYTDSTKAGIEQTVQNAVDACIELDMYVIIDWHILQDQSPQVRKADALRFFDYISAKYAEYPNVIYEICNEPNGYASWGGDIKPYAQEVIPVIRKNDPDSVVIVGTPTWSQDIDKALADPLEYDNIMYALHYYAATHTDWLRDRLKNCYNNGLPIMVSEFGNCDASGNGSNNFDQARKWLELLDSLNISYMNWSLCDKAEAASILRTGASATGGWTDNDLTENGRFMRDWFKSHD